MYIINALLVKNNFLDTGTCIKILVFVDVFLHAIFLERRNIHVSNSIQVCNF